MKKKELKKRIDELTDLSVKLYRQNNELKRNKANAIMHLIDYQRKVGRECLTSEEEIVNRCITIVRQSYGWED